LRLKANKQEEKTWITRGHMMNITYARKVMMLLLVETELRDLFEAMKNVMLCISYLKLATLRVKAMKAIKKLIVVDPEILSDSQILKIIQLRLADVSSSTREMTLDLLWHCLTKVNFENEAKSHLFEQEFVNKYLDLVVERADDNNLGVRKKVV